MIRKILELKATNTHSGTATGMFGQIDGLSVPGAGLRSLDFPSDVQSMFADLFIPHDAGHPPAQMEPTPSPSNISTQSLVRTYGSEHDMWVLRCPNQTTGPF